VLAAVVGCYSPNIRAGAPCGEGEACPVGQTCRAGFCRADDGSDVDAPLEIDGSSIDSAVNDGPLVDAPPSTCAGGNNVCLVACVATDPDCTTTCGDNRCVGNAGELCGNCAGDCATTSVVCGNAQCQPGESPDCYADCGPVPWTWSAEEQQLITLINNARTTGFACPNAASVTRPALTVDTSMTGGAREWAWEMAHSDYFGSTADGCNGRTYVQRKLDGGNFTGYVRSRGYGTVQLAFDAWMASATQCPIVMSANATKVYASAAFDTAKSYLMVIK
jgi:uncharacterized protein YkwD